MMNDPRSSGMIFYFLTGAFQYSVSEVSDDMKDRYLEFPAPNILKSIKMCK